MSGNTQIWYHQYPTPAKATDFVGKPLLLTETPPEETSFGGMKLVYVNIKGDTTKTFKIMMTEQDISKAIDLYVNTGVFTFAKIRDTQYPVVTAFIENSNPKR